jgi:hypothetical protein
MCGTARLPPGDRGVSLQPGQGGEDLTAGGDHRPAMAGLDVDL